MKRIVASRPTALLLGSLTLLSTASAHPGHGPVENFSHDTAHALSHLAAPIVASIVVIALVTFLVRRPKKQKVRVRR